MSAPRMMQQSLRRVTACGSSNGLLLQPRLAAVATSTTAPLTSMHNTTQTRSAASQTIKQSEGHEILAQQRLKRPVSPHLSIYKPQITWLGSISHRMTGAVVSGAFYVYGFGYLVAPLLGYHIGSHELVATMAALPLVAKLSIKSTLGFMFVYHSLNGLRHLLWDTGSAMTNKAVNATGWTVVAASVATTAGLLMW